MERRIQVRHAIFALVVLGTVLSTAQASTLKQLHVITRHGARMPLPKEAATLEEDKVGSILTRLGQEQHYSLGVWLRTRYEDSGFFDKYVPTLARLESSPFDRTIVSANSLALGLFPESARIGGASNASNAALVPLEPARIPVYSQSDHNDIHIRAYQNCPVFTDNLSKLYDSIEWKNLEATHHNLLSQLATLVPRLADEDTMTKTNKLPFISLENLWNVYDEIHVAKTECTESPYAKTCLELPDPTIRDIVDDDRWLELETLAHQAEYMKYGPTAGGNLLGSNLLWRILARTPTPGQFYLYSAHYPTLLGMFTTLQEELQQPSDVLVLPDYASALIFEIYEDITTKEQTVSVLYKDGSQDSVEYLSLQLCTHTTTPVSGAKTSCPLTDLLHWASKNTLATEDDWCTACGNDSTDVCMKAALEEKGCRSPLANGLFGQEDNRDQLAGLIIATLVIGILFGMMLLAIVGRCCTRKSVMAKAQDNEPQVSSSSSSPVPSTDVETVGIEQPVEKPDAVDSGVMS
jgi:hypothetical protein